jgi:hypothetical protein
VDDLLVAGGTSILVAKAKTGKSVLSRQLAVAVAQGKDFLGRKTMRGGVVYAGLEDNAQKSAQHFDRLGVTDEDAITLFDMWQQATAATLRATLEAKPHTALVIVDTLFRMFPVQSADDYMQVTRTMDNLLALSKQYNVHICALHHLGKKERDDAQDGILGSTAIGGSVETIMIMPRRGEQRSFLTRQRYGDEMAETKLIYDKQIGRSSLAIPTETDGLPETDTPYTRIRRAICSFLQTNPGATRSVVIGAVSGDATLKIDTLRLMTGSRLRQEGTGKKGNPYRYWLTEIPIERDPITAVTVI